MDNVESRNVISIIAQYLHDNNLNTTLTALEKETGLIYDAPLEIASSVLEGNWEQVFTALKPEVNQDLFEQIFQQICLERLADGAALNDTIITALMRRIERPERRKLIEDTWHTSSKLDTKISRSLLAEKVEKELKLRTMKPAEPNKLLRLISRLPTGSFERILSRETRGTAACFHKNQLFVARADGLIEQWNRETGETISCDMAVETHATCLFSHGDLLAAGCVDGSVYCWLGGKLHIYPHHTCITKLLFHDADLIVGDEAGSIRCINLETGRITQENRHTAAITDLAMDGKLLCTASRDGSVKRGTELLPKIGLLPHAVTAIVTVDGCLLAAVSQSGIYQSGGEWNCIYECREEVVSMTEKYAITVTGTLIEMSKTRQRPSKFAVSGACWSNEHVFTWNEKGECCMLPLK